MRFKSLAVVLAVPVLLAGCSSTSSSTDSTSSTPVVPPSASASAAPSLPILSSPTDTSGNITAPDRKCAATIKVLNKFLNTTEQFDAIGFAAALEALDLSALSTDLQQRIKQLAIDGGDISNPSQVERMSADITAILEACGAPTASAG